MRTPKSLLQLAESVNGTVEIITFRGNGQLNTGFAVVDGDGNELLEIEPVWYSNGDRWIIRNRCIKDKIGISYRKRLAWFKADIKPGWTGYKFSR